jgi:hypothetical protein
MPPLRDAAERHGVAVLGISHTNREKGSSPRNRAADSIGFRQVCRANWVFGLDPDDPSGKRGRSRVLAFDKGNLGADPASLRVKLSTVSIQVQGQTVNMIRADFAGECNHSAADVLDAEANYNRTEKKSDAVVFLRKALPAPSKIVENLAKEEGIAPATLRRARKDLGVISEQRTVDGKRVWWMRLPPVPTLTDERSGKLSEGPGCDSGGNGSGPSTDRKPPPGLE